MVTPESFEVISLPTEPYIAFRASGTLKNFVSIICSTCQMFPWRDGPNEVPFLLRMAVPQTLPWEPYRLLHMTARLGLPLKCRDGGFQAATYGHTPEELKAREKFKLVDTHVNLIMRNLSMRVTPGANLVAFMRLEGDLSPNLMIGRMDGKNLHAADVYVMWAFVQEQIDKAGLILHYEGDTSVSVPDSFCANMTPEKFVEFWNDPEKCRTVPREHLECPVKLGCRACGKEGGKLMQCGKCGVVKYCGRDCQRSDWSVHKEVCVEA